MICIDINNRSLLHNYGVREGEPCANPRQRLLLHPGLANIEAVRQLAWEACDLGAGAIALLGNLTPKNTDPREYAEVLRALSEVRLPAFYVPGPEDAPFSEFQREAASFEVVYPNVRGVHGTFAMSPGQVVWSGMGGTIEDHPDTIRDEVGALCYPGWEVEYRLKFLQELKDYQKVFMFTTFPEHKGGTRRAALFRRK